MRVLLQGRSARSLAVTPGGDQVQIEQTARALRERHGIDARTSSELEPDLHGVDIVHLFGVVRPQEVWVQARHAKRAGVPIALSTVYCDVWEYERRAREGLVGRVARHTNRNVIEALKAGGRGVRSREWSKGSAALFTRGYRRMQRETLELADVFLPNSESEWKRLTKDIGMSVGGDSVVVVPNGVDLGTLAENSVRPIPSEVEPFTGCVLCVARIEGRKNQLALAEALAGTDITLVLAGKPARNQPGYVARVRELADMHRNVHVLGAVSEETKYALYRVARVHALPSWIETTGLSSLEAAVSGCSLVVSPNGDTREYFGSDAEYCDPASPEDIRGAIRRALGRPPAAGLESRIRDSYTWEAAADATRRAYEVLLGSDSNPPHHA